MAGHPNHRNAKPFDQREYRHQFVGLATVRNSHHQVVWPDHSEVPVARLARVYKHRRCSGRSQCGRHFPTYVPTLAHSHHDHPPTNAEHQRDGLGERDAGSALEPGDRGGLDVKSLVGKGDRALGAGVRILHVAIVHRSIL